jgi:hypothetical protein
MDVGRTIRLDVEFPEAIESSLTDYSVGNWKAIP